MQDYTAHPQTKLERQVGHHLCAAQHETAQTTLHVDADVTALHARLAATDGAARFATYVLHAAIAALRDHPALNAHLATDGLYQYRHVKLGVMVDTGHGIMQACIAEADRLDVGALETALTDLRHRARHGFIHMDDTRGATFGVADLSMYAVDTFDPILVPSAVALLGIGRVRPGCRPTPDGHIEVAHFMSLSLTIDHQGCDGLRAGRYLTTLATRLSEADLTIPHPRGGQA